MTSRQVDPLTYIITINWNGIDDTLQCLDSLKSLAHDNYKTVVVDNNSEGDQAEKIERLHPEVIVIKNQENLGFTGGCNQGMEMALKDKASYVVLLNNDTTVTSDFLRKNIEFYESTSDAGMVSPIILYPDKKRIWFAGAKVKLGIIRHLYKGKTIESLDIPDAPYRSDYVPGTALLISTELIKKIGKLDDQYFAYYEDLDWAWKAEKIGRYPYIVPHSIVYHKKSGSTSEGGHRKWTKVPAFYVARNSIFLAKNYEGVAKLGFVLAQIFIKLPLNLLLLVTPSAWGSYLKGTIAGLKNL